MWVRVYIKGGRRVCVSCCKSELGLIFQNDLCFCEIALEMEMAGKLIGDLTITYCYALETVLNKIRALPTNHDRLLFDVLCICAFLLFDKTHQQACKIS